MRTFSFSPETLSVGEKLAIESKQDTMISHLSSIAGTSIPPYDSKTLTYVASGNGIGQVETVVYKDGATTVATRTFTYNANHRVITDTVT